MISQLKKSRIFICLLVSFFSFASISSPAYSAILSTAALAQDTALDVQKDALADQLLRDDVKAELTALGVDPLDIEKRIHSLSAAELSQVQGQLATIPAGGDGLSTVALVLLILILLEITGLIDIFPKI